MTTFNKPLVEMSTEFIVLYQIPSFDLDKNNNCLSNLHTILNMNKKGIKI